MNLTLSIDDQLVEKAREVARRQGTSLQELLRTYVATLVGVEADVTADVQRLWEKSDQHLAAHPPAKLKWRREDAYEERLSRFKP